MTHAPMTPALLQAVLRKDFSTFVGKVFQTLVPGQIYLPGWYVNAIVHQLEGVRSGEIRRLIINMPPRSLKSLTASVAFPAFLLGQDPTKRIICVSYSNDLSRKMSNDFRAVISAPWYKDLFPNTRIGRFKDTENEIEMSQRGSRLATSVEGTLTGRGGDLIIIDDPLKGNDARSDAKREAVNAWYTNTLISRLDNKLTGAIVIVMQRVHMDDLTGFVLGGSDDWTVLNLPAIAEMEETIALPQGRFHYRRVGDVLVPDREPMEVLAKLKSQLGSDVFSAQYQQAPVPPGGAMFKRAWVRRYRELPAFPSEPIVIQSWDTAMKGGPDNDWSVCTTWNKQGAIFYLVDVWRGRVDYPTLKAKVVELSSTWKARKVLVEEAGTAVALVEELRGRVSGLIGVKPKHDKATRASVASAKFEAGQVLLPESASWLADLEAELFAFPSARHDDQVDSISQAINEPDPLILWEALGRDSDEPTVPYYL